MKYFATSSLVRLNDWAHRFDFSNLHISMLLIEARRINIFKKTTVPIEYWDK